MPPMSAPTGPFDLCALGDFCWDVIVHTPDELRRGGDTLGSVELHAGGSAANTAVWAARCGAAVGFVGMVGDDRLGMLAADDLRAEGVAAHLPESTARPTGAVASFVDHTGERSMVTGVGADHLLLPEHVPLDMVAASRHLHLTGWSLFGDPPRAAAQAAARMARAAGATVSFDPSAHQMITEMGVDAFIDTTVALAPAVVFPNRNEGSVLTGQSHPAAIAGALERLYGGALVVLKLDAEGALVWRDGVGAFVPAIEAVAADTTGAGDAFAGAFLARWLAGDDPDDAATYAVRVAAWVVARQGARPAGWSLGPTGWGA
jgi:ribokinase